MSGRGRGSGRWVWGLVVILGILHYDFWLWEDRSLWFGFLPAGLGYHALYSVAAGLTWALAVKYAWPSQVEEWGEQGEGGENRGTGGTS